ncbi:MAG: AraC family transcriptional regulator [Kiritimatiellae bacterium]|nr:AraC family transcriptional regulator [Kiritimatiellia bacterium]
MREWILPARGANSDEELYVSAGGRHQVSSIYRKRHHGSTLCALVYVLSGHGFVQYGGRRHLAGPDDLFAVLMGRNVSYWTSPDDPWLFLWVSFGGRRAAALMTRAGLTTSTPVLRSPSIRELRIHFLELHQLGSAETAGASFSVLGKLWMILGLLIDLQSQRRQQERGATTGDFDLTAKVSRYLAEHWSEPVTLGLLSRMFHRSPCCLARRFQNEMAQAPIDYLIDLRIHQAQRMLLDETRSVAEVAAAVSYQDPAYFSRLFRKRTGISPLQYRQQQAGLFPRRSK